MHESKVHQSLVSSLPATMSSGGEEQKLFSPMMQLSWGDIVAV